MIHGCQSRKIDVSPFSQGLQMKNRVHMGPQAEVALAAWTNLMVGL